MSRSANRRNGGAKTITVVLLIVASLAIGLWYILGPPGGNQSGQFTKDDLRRAINAVASSEDAEYDRAIKLWKQLQAILPNDPVVQMNRAVTVLKWIDETNESLTSGNVTDPQEKERLQAELKVAYSQADELVRQVSSLDASDARAALLKSALMEAKARQNYPNDLGFLKQAAEILAECLRGDPAQPLVAAQFDELLVELGDDASEYKPLNADALLASWRTQPRNLYLLSRAANSLLAIEDPRLDELLDPCVENTRPMWSLIAPRMLERIDPPGLIQRLHVAIQDNDWDTVRAGRTGLSGWLNMFMSMSFRDDRRLVLPDIMAMLDTTFLQQLAAKVPEQETAPAPVPVPVFSEHDLVAADAIAWYDFDVDLRYELAVVREQELSVLSIDDAGSFSVLQKLALSSRPNGILVADLRLVEDPRRLRSPASVAELMARKEAASSSQDDTKISVAGKRHDTFQELVLWGQNGVSIVTLIQEGTEFKLAELSDSVGLGELTGVLAASAADLEADGDLDLVFATTDGVKVFRNNGDRTFANITEFSLVADAPGAIDRLVSCDFDGDLDLDFLATSPDATELILLENILHGQLRYRGIEDDRMAGSASGVLEVADVDGNGAWDVLVANSDELSLSTTRVSDGTTGVKGRYRLPLKPVAIQVGDINNDSYSDIVCATADGVQAVLRQGDSLENRSPTIQLLLETASAEKLALADFNNDGAQDIAVLEDGTARLLLNQPGSTVNHLSVRVRGINDVNGGGRNNHFAIGSVLELWNDGRMQRRQVRMPSTHFGTGATQADDLRIVFANGLTQNVESPEQNVVIEEIQELKGSCPFIYGWDGERFQLITDLLWNAPLGLQVERGQVVPDRRWENLLLPGKLVQAHDGYYELRITEELWEVAYFDQVSLLAVDHPLESRVFTNEKVGPPSIAEHRLFEIAEEVYPSEAHDAYGRDIRSKLLNKDGEYVTAFDNFICQGLVEPHYIELDFGGASDGEGTGVFARGSDECYLVLSGWMHPTDTALNIGISQNSERSGPEPPSIWVVDESGNWVCSAPLIGFPGGKPKSIVVPLAGVFRSDDRRIRVGASQQVYWDEVFVANSTAPRDIVEHPLGCESAELRYRGFSRLLPRAMDKPHWYDYQDVSRNAKWLPLEGPYTRFGDVKEIVLADDDRLVVMASGDELVLRFAIPDAKLPNGWTRDFVLHSVGWDKDADLNTIAGQSSMPLPFKAQQSYPAPPSQWEESKKAFDLNAPTLTRQKQIAGRRL